jgi:glucan 1,3-beta-glucosidase
MSRWWVLPCFALATLVALAVWWWRAQPVAVADVAGGRVPCVSYAPFRDGQSPFDESLVIPPAQIEDDLRALSAFTACVRTYATDQGLEEVPRIAHALGLKVMLGAWIGHKPAKNALQLRRAVDLAERYPETVTALIVGNEVLLRREQPADRLAALIAETRDRVAVPVTYADVWEFWEKNPEIARVVDFVTIHTLPYWEDEPVAVETAIDHIVATWRRVQALFPDKRVFIGEAGWPSAGRMREGALPSLVNQARFVRELLARATQEGIGINLIEAFDQPWKRKLEGTVGGHWGLFTADRRAKFALTGPVAADPDWRRRFATATVLAALGLIAALWGRRPRALPLLGLAFFFQLCAGALVLAWGDLLAANRTPLDWAGGLVQLSLASVTTVLAGTVMAAARPVPPLAAEPLLNALQRRASTPGPPLALAIGSVRLALAVAAAALTLALVFESRNRDFPIALYLPPVLALALLAVRAGRNVAAARRIARSRREEVLLAGILAVGGAVIAAREGVANLEAIGWAALVVSLAATLLAATAPPGFVLEADGADGTQHQAERGGAGRV